MTDSPEDLAAVEQLLAESDALRGWLARLEQAPASAPSAIRERVRGDYQRRLDEITAGLSAHADVVSTKLDEDRVEHAALLARATGARDGLAEAELRHIVGEYDDTRFEGERRRFTSDMESFDLALSAVAERIARLEEVHALVQREPRAPIVDFKLALDEPAAPVESEAVAIDDLAPDAEEALAVFDEHREPDAEPAEPATAAPSSGPDNGPLSFRPSGNGSEWTRPIPPPATRPFGNAAPLGIPAADVPPRFVRNAEKPAPPASVPSGVAAQDATMNAGDGDSPAVADTNATPVGRTLRCGECGAMNRPLEWYCEKCGAELTAV